MHFQQEGESTFPICETLEKSGKIKKRKGVSFGFSKNEAIWDLDKSFSGETGSSQMGWGGLRSERQVRN